MYRYCLFAATAVFIVSRPVLAVIVFVVISFMLLLLMYLLIVPVFVTVIASVIVIVIDFKNIFQAEFSSLLSVGPPGLPPRPFPGLSGEFVCSETFGGHQWRPGEAKDAE